MGSAHGAEGRRRHERRQVDRRTKPVVFYGTSITHGGCCSRPGLSFGNRVGRDLDVPVVNLGFSGSGVMEFEMSEHLAKIDGCHPNDLGMETMAVAFGAAVRQALK